MKTCPDTRGIVSASTAAPRYPASGAGNVPAIFAGFPSYPSGILFCVNLKPYRQVLAVRGVRTLLLVGILARVPATATVMTLTLFVTATGRSWAQAGLVVAAYTVGAALGQPLTGRFLDRRGLRA